MSEITWEVAEAQTTGTTFEYDMLDAGRILGYVNNDEIVYRVHTGKIVSTVTPPGLTHDEIKALCVALYRMQVES